jgi:hypothetical protein
MPVFSGEIWFRFARPSPNAVQQVYQSHHRFLVGLSSLRRRAGRARLRMLGLTVATCKQKCA